MECTTDGEKRSKCGTVDGCDNVLMRQAEVFRYERQEGENRKAEQHEEDLEGVRLTVLQLTAEDLEERHVDEDARRQTLKNSVSNHRRTFRTEWDPAVSHLHD